MKKSKARMCALIVRRVSFLAVSVTAVLLASHPLPAEAVSFRYKVGEPGYTSAGIFDPNGRLVRSLWSMKQFGRGSFRGEWDGRDDDQQPVPPGEYGWKVVVNRSTYENIGVIGNTGEPPTTFGHVPVFIMGVAIDAQDGVYTVHDWDEAHFNVIKWSATNGQAEFNTGNITLGSLLRAVAVEPDGSKAYVTGYSDINNRGKARFSIQKFSLDFRPGQSKREPFSQEGESISVYNGNVQLPDTVQDVDKDLMMMPLNAIALRGDLIYATDAYKGRVLIYNKVTGALKKEFPAPLAFALAVDGEGRIWVGHEHHKISVFDADGKLLATPVNDLESVRAITLLNDRLYVADNGAGQVKVYRINGCKTTLVKTFGQKAGQGDRAPDHFFCIAGLGVDSKGNIIVSQVEPGGGGSRLVKFSPDFKPLWEQMGLEFSSQGAYGMTDPDLLITMHDHAYRLDRKSGKADYLGYAGAIAGDYFGAGFKGGHHGRPNVVKMGEHNFAFLPRGDGIAVYRITAPADDSKGPTLNMVAALAGRTPLPDGRVPKDSYKAEYNYLWSWSDDQGDNTPQKDEIKIYSRPEDKFNWSRGAMTVDERGWIWMVSNDRQASNSPPEKTAMYAFPPQGFNKLGNPIYDWSSAIRMGPVSSNGPGYKLIERSSDGMIYAMGPTRKKDAPSFGGAHMGGNMLVAFKENPGAETANERSQLLWSILLPRVAVGMAAISGGNGGVMLGGDPGRGTIHHYSRDGLLIGAFQSASRFGWSPRNHPTGMLDNLGAVACFRDPRDGILDVFSEDNFNQRIIWYRVDDHDIQTIEGRITIQ